MPFTLAQQKALAIVPHVTGPLSMFGSFCIMRSAVKDMMKGTATTYHRLLLGMSCLDFLASFWWGLSTIPIPRGTPGVWRAMGNTATCTAQGLFVHLGTAVPAYNVALAVHALLMAKCEWKAKRIQAVEPLMHVCALAYACTTALAGIPLKLYNSANLWCWIAPLPMGCKDSARYGTEANCIRGDNAWLYRIVFGYGFSWVCIIICAILMAVIYHKVLRQEKAVDKVQEEGLMLRKQSTRVAWQAFWYIMSLCLTWTPVIIIRLLQAAPATRGQIHFPLVMSFAVFLPLQGFLNFLVFFRARFLKHRRGNPNGDLQKAIGVAAFGSDEDEEDVTSDLDFPTDS